VKIAVLGTGSAGLRHLMAIRSLDGVEPIAVPIRTARLTELEAHGFVTVPDLHSASSNGARAAIIATDTARHADDAVAALKEGLDVLVEKPLAVDASQAHKVCEVASKLGRRVYVGCQLRFFDSLVRFRQTVAGLGRLHSVRIECQSYLPCWRPDRPYRDSYSARAEEGGVLRDLIHEIDYAGWLFGWPDACQARLSNLGRLEIGAEEVADLTWETPAGVLVSMTLDYLSRPSRRQMRACGEWGTAEWDALSGTVTLTTAGSPMQRTNTLESSRETSVALICAFIDACGGSEDPRLATCEEGCKALAVCDAARRASNTRREERVEYL
jgi:predicted dehydrogenase